MAVNVFSLEGNLQVNGLAEAKAGLESVAAAGKETAAALNSSGGGVLGGFPAATAKQMEILGQAEGAFKKMGLSGEELNNSMKAAARGLGEVIERYRGLLEIYGIIKAVEFTKEAIEQAASLHELSQKTGATVEMLSLLEFAGRRADVTAEQLTIGFRGFALALRNLSSDESPKVVEAFAKIGLSAKDFQGLNTDEAFKKVVAAMAPFPDGMEKSAIAASLFGRSGMLLIPLLDDLATNGFAKTTEEGKKFHAIFGKELSDNADKLKDSLGDLRFELEAIARLLIGPLNVGVQNLVALMTGNMHAAFLSFAKGFDLGTFGLLPSMFDHLTRKWAVEDSSNPAATGDPGHRAGKILSPFSGKDDADADKNPQGTEIALLKEKFELNRAGAADLTRLFVLEGQLTQALDAKNLSMKEELRLARDLKAAREAILDAAPPLLAPDKLPGVSGRPVSQKDRLDLSGYIGGLNAPQQTGGNRGDAVNRIFDEMIRAGENVKYQFATLGQGLGMAVAHGFSSAMGAAMQGKNPFKAFGQTVLAGLGGIFTQMGEKLIVFGITMLKLLPFLSNPFTSGPAAIAAGILLVGLGTALGAIAGGGGGSGSGGGGGAAKDQITQIHLTADGAGGFTAPHAATPTVYKVLGASSPEGQRILGEHYKAARRSGNV